MLYPRLLPLLLQDGNEGLRISHVEGKFHHGKEPPSPRMRGRAPRYLELDEYRMPLQTPKVQVVILSIRLTAQWKELHLKIVASPATVQSRQQKSAPYGCPTNRASVRKTARYSARETAATSSNSPLIKHSSDKGR